MKKVVGYIVSLVGILAVAFPLVPDFFSSVPVPEGIPDLYFTVGGVILVVLGLAFLVKRGGNIGRTGGGSRRGAEVPIYEGKNVVGYRRH